MHNKGFYINERGEAFTEVIKFEIDGRFFQVVSYHYSERKPC